ncbi:MAG: hypothetical protein LQ338_002009 [Usnochroma carphineum]|nr:MAG: hypothetical protein LQ338_002009 [Usnochroma carphineum]
MADYHKLACMIATHGEAAIFRRFDTLNIKNLLYMQAELVHLEAELRQIELEEKSSADPNRTAYPFSVYDLRESACSGKVTQWTKYLEIQSKLQAYSMCYKQLHRKDGALLQYLALRKVAKPSSNAVEVLQGWLDRPEGGDFFLKGREAYTWEMEKDLVSLNEQQPGQDGLTKLINEKLVPWYHRRWGHRTQKPSLTAESYGVWQYDQEKLNLLANAISTLLASLLPSISILVLYLLSRPVTKLVAILWFSVFFSLVLSAVSTARRIEIFAATTA